ncbi:hypothetical protein NWFMUON74_51300 [Nocardia wallacei]|uniref:Uncharacterized protein n=1 Tax=Nocardia wallacei TaxID=480035 RepID=A0A7G1KQ19_9NOCA|nr:hypothetical protein NWFMUON74_51300 [Nocardia wallacei]
MPERASRAAVVDPAGPPPTTRTCGLFPIANSLETADNKNARVYTGDRTHSGLQAGQQPEPSIAAG